MRSPVKPIFVMMICSIFCVSLATSPRDEASSFGTTMIVDSTGGDKNLDWNPSTVPSFITTRVEKNVSKQADSDEFFIETPTFVQTTNLTFENITINPFVHEYETRTTSSQMANGFWVTTFYQEIRVPTSCYIAWIRMFTQFANVNNNAQNWTVSIYNATQDPTMLAQPGQEIAGTAVEVNPGDNAYLYTNPNYNKPHWENVSMPAVMLDSTMTYSVGGMHSFFVAARIPALSSAFHHWYCSNDTEIGSADDAGRAFQHVAIPFSSIQELAGIDFTLVAKLLPPSSSPDPTDISLEVNGEPVLDTGTAAGRYITSERFYAVNGKVVYDITSCWSNFGPGSLRYDLVARCIQGTTVVPGVRAAVADNSSPIRWTIDFNISFPQEISFMTANLTSYIPLSWSSLVFTNITGSTHTTWPFAVNITPVGKSREFTATGITPGTWRVNATSARIPGIASLNLAGGAIDLDAALSGNVTVQGGPNGHDATVRSDYEGGIAAFAPVGSIANDTFVNRILYLDNKSIEFSNASTNNLWALIPLLKPELQDNVIELGVGNEIDMFITAPEGFRAENINDIEIVLDHEPFSKNFWFANTSGMRMPDNQYWNPSGYLPKDYFWRGLLGLPDSINFTYDVAGHHYSDLYMNFTTRIRGNMTSEITLDLVETVYFDLKTNFPASNTTHALYIKNQTSGIFAKLNATTCKQTAEGLSRITWDSRNEAGIANLVDFINPLRNTIEAFLRVSNTTILPSTAASNHDVYILSSFDYSNTFQNFTATIYNWTAAAYDGRSIVSSVVQGKQATRLDFGAILPSTSDYFNASTNMIRMTTRASAVVPLLSSVTWSIDRALLNVSYIDYVRCTWQQSVYNASGFSVVNQVNTTLFDAPNNNFTTSIGVDRILDFCDDYTYEMFWHNGTDIMECEVPFRINREPASISITSDIDRMFTLDGEYHSVEANLEYSTNATAIPGKEIILSFSIVYRNGTVGTEELAAVTRDDGSCTFGFQVNSNWRTFYIVAMFVSDNPRVRDATTSPTTTFEVFNQADYAMRVLVNNALTIAMGVALFVAFVVAKRRLDAKKKRGWKVDSDKIRDITKIRHLFVLVKNGGTCVVDRTYSQTKLDGDLISGFLSAITSFGKEVGLRGTMEKKDADETTLFDYQEFKILMHQGSAVQVALILSGAPTDNLKENLKTFVRLFESRFDINAWKGNLAAFNGVDDLIEQAFEITMIYPLVVNAAKDPATIKTNLARSLLDIARAVQAEKKTFHLSTLLTYAMAGRREVPEHILAEIYWLKHENYLTFSTTP
nr:hypothetical protein [Candidatus Sigynarchaeota archaeon]